MVGLPNATAAKKELMSCKKCVRFFLATHNGTNIGGQSIYPLGLAITAVLDWYPNFY